MSNFVNIVFYLFTVCFQVLFIKTELNPDVDRSKELDREMTGVTDAVINLEKKKEELTSRQNELEKKLSDLRIEQSASPDTPKVLFYKPDDSQLLTLLDH